MAIRDDEFWSKFLGVEPSAWNLSGISIRAHVGLKGYTGLWCFRRLDHTVISAPAGWISVLQSRIGTSEANKLLDQAFLTGLFGDDFVRLIGPAFQGCLDPAKFHHVAANEVRSLKPEDSNAYQEFRSQCSPSVADSGLDKAADRVGYFLGSALVAVAGYRAWTDSVGDPCILTHPDFYGRGYGTAVASAVVQRALTQGKLLLYQTLEANTGAVRIARSLGYEQYARHVAVRLRGDTPGMKHA